MSPTPPKKGMFPTPRDISVLPRGLTPEKIFSDPGARERGIGLIPVDMWMTPRIHPVLDIQLGCLLIPPRAPGTKKFFPGVGPLDITEIPRGVRNIPVLEVSADTPARVPLERKYFFPASDPWVIPRYPGVSKTYQFSEVSADTPARVPLEQKIFFPASDPWVIPRYPGVSETYQISEVSAGYHT